MDFELTAKNYRCFTDANLLRVSISDGFTAIVGANNTGKSTILRLFYELRGMFASVRDERGLGSALLNSSMLPRYQGLADPASLFSHQSKRAMEIEVSIRGRRIPDEAVAAKFVVKRDQYVSTSLTLTSGAVVDHDSVDAKRFRPSGKIRLERGETEVDSARMVAVLNDLWDTMYIGSLRNALDLASESPYYDIQVGRGFIDQWRGLKDGLDDEARLARGIELSIATIFGFEHVEITPASDGKTLRLMIDGEPHRLSDVGTGISHFVIALVSVAIRRPAWILIDEPELGLHPALQMRFLTALGSYASKGVIFATHSLGLARTVANRIYTTHRIGAGRVQVRQLDETRNLSEFLGMIGFSAHQELGYEMILLVEGPTDVPVIQHLLRVYKKDHRVVLLPLGGANMINGSVASQLGEIKRLCPKVVALIDSERVAEGAEIHSDRIAFVAACSAHGIQCHVLARRATENYFTEAAIQSVEGETARALGPFEKPDQRQNKWQKGRNWLIAQGMSRDDVDATDLGQFLAKL